MRELDAWHGDRRHHAPDTAADTPATRAHDSPKHEILRDPAVRIAKHLEYRKIAEAAQAEHAAGQLKPAETRPEHEPPETRDKPASKIAERREPPENQEQKQRRPERPWLPSNETTQVAAGVGIFVSSIAEAVNILPGRWDAVAASSEPRPPA